MLQNVFVLNDNQLNYKQVEIHHLHDNKFAGVLLERKIYVYLMLDQISNVLRFDDEVDDLELM